MSALTIIRAHNQKAQRLQAAQKSDGTPAKSWRLMQSLCRGQPDHLAHAAALIGAALMNQFSSSVQKGWRRKA